MRNILEGNYTKPNYWRIPSVPTDRKASVSQPHKTDSTGALLVFATILLFISSHQNKEGLIEKYINKQWHPGNNPEIPENNPWFKKIKKKS